MDTHSSYNSPNRLQNLVRLYFLHVYSLLCQLCDSSWDYGKVYKATWPGVLSVKYTAVFYVYHNTGTVDVNIRLT